MIVTLREARSSEFGVFASRKATQRSSEFGVCPTGTLSLTTCSATANGVFALAKSYATEYSLFPSENGAYKVRPQVTHTAPPLREREKLRNGVMIFSTREWAIQTLENQNITEFLVF